MDVVIGIPKLNIGNYKCEDIVEIFRDNNVEDINFKDVDVHLEASKFLQSYGAELDDKTILYMKLIPYITCLREYNYENFKHFLHNYKMEEDKIQYNGEFYQ